MTTTTRTVSHLADGIDRVESLVKWSENEASAYDAFANILPQERQILTSTLHEMLINRVSDGEMVQDLQALVENALETHEG